MTTPRTVALAVSGNFGRRTGVQIRSNIPKGADGFDNINEFWDEGGKEAETEVPTIIEKVSSPPARKSLPRKPNATPSPAGPSNNAIASAMSPQASAQGPSPSTPVANFDAVDFDPPASAQPEKEATPVESAKKTSFKPPRKSTKPLFSSGDADTEPDEKVDAAAPAPPVPARKSGGRKSKVTPLKPVVEAKEEEDEEVEVEKGGKGKQTSPAVPLRRTSGVRRKSAVVEKTPVRRAIVSDVESGPSEGEEEVEKPVKVGCFCAHCESRCLFDDVCLCVTRAGQGREARRPCQRQRG